MTNTASTPVADHVANVIAGMAQQVPGDVLQAFGAEQTALDSAGVPAGIAEAGMPMPDAELLDVNANTTTLERARAGRAAVVVFYRGAWCPFCNAALRVYQSELAGELDEHGAALIAVSPQKPDGSLTMKEANELSYAVLSDPGNRIGRQLGIVTRPTDEVQRAQAALGLDLTTVNADGSHDILMPTVAIVDADGILRWIDVHPNYTTRTEPAQILAALTSLG
ncbi:peroxiredoxin-like family protein [Streptomyces sp. NBC_01497]|uniref:peroxiredoxin-like family protein n=1 Tax=Streptomyces sp. NBC_01497 TaxID=2903885 RepID=UPI002E363BE6|nr:peroxiredoxin-like family protein [Streptomyces sp. NBC_01497]